MRYFYQKRFGKVKSLDRCINSPSEWRIAGKVEPDRLPGHFARARVYTRQNAQ